MSEVAQVILAMGIITLAGLFGGMLVGSYIYRRNSK